MFRRLSLIAPVLLVLALAVLALPSGSASADGGPHVKGWGATPDDCAACHRAHRGAAEPLLVTEEDLLCLSCHGDSAMGSDLNVSAGTEEDTGGALRGGGFSNARIKTDDPSLPPSATILALPAPGEPTQSNHSVDSSVQTIWGYGDISAAGDPGRTGFGLACGKCHDPHGSGNYRALRTTPAGLLEYGQPRPSWMPDLTGLLADESPKQYSISDYWQVTYTDQWVDSNGDNIADQETTGRQVGKWCTTCHTRYWASTGSADTDSGDAIFAYRHTTNPEGRDTHGKAGAVTLSGSCLKCHVAHGSNATMGYNSGNVENPDGTVGSGANNSKLLKMDNRGICQKCHNK